MFVVLPQSKEILSNIAYFNYSNDDSSIDDFYSSVNPFVGDDIDRDDVLHIYDTNIPANTLTDLNYSSVNNIYFPRITVIFTLPFIISDYTNVTDSDKVTLYLDITTDTGEVKTIELCSQKLYKSYCNTVQCYFTDSINCKITAFNLKVLSTYNIYLKTPPRSNLSYVKFSYLYVLNC